MSIKRTATATWQGTGAEGTGVLNTSNKFFDNTPYSFKSRFQNEDGTQGTNPEELIAAAHAGCFAMALSFALTQAGHAPTQLNATAAVNLEAVEGGFGITSIALQLHGVVPGITEAQFIDYANGAKANCPISKALSAVPITLATTFTAA